jgi:glycosyltransferase involved in cell wall biosynthesis
VDFSVIICSYNRCESLRRTLQSIEAMICPADVKWEVIVVDNNSTDGTALIVDQFQRNNRVPIVYLFQALQGKSYALNFGISNSKGDIVLFIDDDCIVDEDWLSSINKEFKRDDSLSGVGGRVELYDSRDQPVSIRTFRERRYLDRSSLFNLIPGCNMAFRRGVFESVGKFDVNFGPGKKMVVEDADFIYRTYKRGFKLVYSPDVLVFHNHGRRTDEQIIALKRSYVIGRGGFYCKHILAGDRDVLKMAYWETMQLIRSLFGKVVDLQWPTDEFRTLLHLAAGGLYELGNRCRILVFRVNPFAVASPQ